MLCEEHCFSGEILIVHSNNRLLYRHREHILLYSKRFSLHRLVADSRGYISGTFQNRVYLGQGDFISP
jgi:hypothetical protein